MRTRTMTLAGFAMAALLGCSDGSGSGSGGGGTSNTTTGSGGMSSATSGGTGGTSGNGGAGGTLSSTTGSGGAGGAADDISKLSDPFDGDLLDTEWKIINPGAVSIAEGGGSLELTLYVAALWYQNSQGVLIYKDVTGNFKATARVHAYRNTDHAQPPAQPVELGGLMARNPAGPPENYTFIVVGYDVDDLSVETKTTVDGQSTYVGPSWPSAEAELRVCRVGSDFVLLKRAIGAASWTQAVQYSRPDLPATLQVGPTIYSQMQPDLSVKFDEVTFAAVTSLADCSAD